MSARTAGGLSLLQGAAFGLPSIPVAMYLHENGRLPWFFGLFEMNGGPWSATYSDDTFIALLLGFLALNMVLALSGWLLWRGHRAGAILNLALLPVEAVFWIGFALPAPWLFGVARLVLIGTAWRTPELKHW